MDFVFDIEMDLCFFAEARGVHRSRVARNANSDVDDVVADMAKLENDFEMGDDASTGFLNDDGQFIFLYDFFNNFTIN